MCVSRIKLVPTPIKCDALDALKVFFFFRFISKFAWFLCVIWIGFKAERRVADVRRPFEGRLCPIDFTAHRFFRGSNTNRYYSVVLRHIHVTQLPLLNQLGQKIEHHQISNKWLINWFSDIATAREHTPLACVAISYYYNVAEPARALSVVCWFHIVGSSFCLHQSIFTHAHAMCVAMLCLHGKTQLLQWVCVYFSGRVAVLSGIKFMFDLSARYVITVCLSCAW